MNRGRRTRPMREFENEARMRFSLHRELAVGRRGFSFSRLLCWRYAREIHLEECIRYTAVQATASRFHRCPCSPVRDRSLHASTGLNHKIVPERLRNAADLRAGP